LPEQGNIGSHFYQSFRIPKPIFIHRLMDHRRASSLSKQHNKRLLPICHKAWMDSCFQMDPPLKWSIVEKFYPITSDIKAPAHLSHLIQKGYHIQMLSPFDKNFSFRCNRCHAPRCCLNTIWNDCVLDSIKAARPLNSDSSVNVKSNICTQFLE